MTTHAADTKFEGRRPTGLTMEAFCLQINKDPEKLVTLSLTIVLHLFGPNSRSETVPYVQGRVLLLCDKINSGFIEF